MLSLVNDLLVSHLPSVEPFVLNVRSNRIGRSADRMVPLRNVLRNVLTARSWFAAGKAQWCLRRKLEEIVSSAISFECNNPSGVVILQVQ
jgi:hypothetical protein